MNNRFILLGFMFCVSSALADSNTLWSAVNASDQAKTTSKSTTVALPLLPDSYELYRLDEDAMRGKLVPANKSSDLQKKVNTIDIELPLPSGEFLNLKISESSMMASELASKYPKIKTYRVDANDNEGIYGVVDITLQGFHAMLFMPDGSRLFIDPRKSGDEIFYISYYAKHYHPAEKKPFECNVEAHIHDDDLKNKVSDDKTAQRSGESLRTYRLAMSATGEYTTFHGGTVAGALSAITTTINRVNVIYERDLAVKLLLVANTDSLIFTDAGTDPFTPSNPSLLLSENQEEVDQTIGSANYDIGHVVGTGGGGLAGLGVVCNSARKAQGETGSPQPVGDAFDIDFVAHEIGHQFAGNHTFNGIEGNCAGGNRSASTAFEPGSGTTIMAYAGICGADNVQNNSDAMFHVGSIVEMSNFINGSGSSCGTESALNNQQPVSSAGNDYDIPANTPFELTGTATDPDGDTLSYSWEQVDVGTASNTNVVELDNAIFRVFLPGNTLTRVFPKLSSILGNSTSEGETLPNIARSMNFSFVVRDQKGGVEGDETLITVSNSTGFKITSHNASEPISPGLTTQVTWDVAGTATSPIDCTAVDILFSADGGNTFSSLSDDTANDGSETITIPLGITEATSARFKVKCADNIFFDISDADSPVITSGLAIKPAILSNLGANNIADPGETVSILIPIQSFDSSTATNVSGVLSSSVAATDIVVANSAYPDIAAASLVNNTTPYQVHIPADHTCGVAIPLTLNASYTLGSNATITSDFSIPVGTVSTSSETNSTAQAIPDNNSTGITSTVTLSGQGVVTQPNITVDVDITHPYRGDLVIALTSPQGTTVALKNAINDSTADLVGNYPNTFNAVGDLSAFNGENLDGIWTLKVSDAFNLDEGTLNSWTLNYSQFVCEIATNTAPVASDSSVSTNEGTATSATLQATDAEGDDLTYSLVSNGTKGNAVITDSSTGAFTYTPADDQTGSDSFTFNVSDGTATSNTATVNVTINPIVAPTFTWDIDGNGTVKPLTDGLLNIRYLFGFTGTTLISGAVDTDATRTTASEIEAYLASGQTASDIDGDGTTEPLTDGLLLLRYLFGFRGDTLIQNAVNDNGSRQTATDIEAYITGLFPE